MSNLGFAVTLLIEIVCGAAGGLAVGRWLRHLSLGAAANSFSGAVGGLVFTWLAARLPGVGRFVGYVENAADGLVSGAGGLTPTILVGAGIAGLLGGSILTVLIGLVRSRQAG